MCLVIDSFVRYQHTMRCSLGMDSCLLTLDSTLAICQPWIPLSIGCLSVLHLPDSVFSIKFLSFILLKVCLRLKEKLVGYVLSNSNRLLVLAATLSQKDHSFAVRNIHSLGLGACVSSIFVRLNHPSMVRGSKKAVGYRFVSSSLSTHFAASPILHPRL